MEIFNLKKWNEVEAKEQYRVEMWNKFSALENLDFDINRARETIKISPKESLGYYGFKKHKPSFD
jgi:hypothetical protein